MTNVGDVFEIKVAGLSSKYLHLVAIDKCNLNSDVVVLYDSLDKVGGEDYIFYTHTTVSHGVHEGLWKKIANLSALNLKRLVFKNFRGMDILEAERVISGKSTWRKPKPNWAVWTPLDKDWHIVNLNEGMTTHAEDGSIFPAADIIFRLKTGKSEFKHHWPEQVLKTKDKTSL